MGFKEIIREKKLGRLASILHHEPVFPNFEKVKTVGVIWQPSQKDAYSFLKDYFKKESVIFRGFCVFEETSNPQEASNTITTNDLNWWGLPKPGITEEFTDISFDVLLNISLQQNFITKYLTTLSKAKFKVGRFASENSYFDLNINIGEKEDALYLAKQQIFYLSQLNKKTGNE